MKSLILNIIVAAAFIFLCGCKTVDWNLPQGFDPSHTTDRILIQIKPATITGVDTDMKNPAIEKKLNAFLYDKFSSSARFVILSERQGDLAGTQNKVLRIFPYLNFQSEKVGDVVLYYWETSILFRFFDLETGADSNNGVDNIPPIKTSCRNPIVIENFYHKPHRDLNFREISTKLDKSFDPVWKELEKRIAEKFPVNAKVLAVQSTGSDTKLVINAGTANGLRNSDLFKVYAVKNNIVTVVATAEGLVGKSNSTLTIKDWNMDDVNVRSVYRPQMENNQADNLYVVAESPLLR